MKRLQSPAQSATASSNSTPDLGAPELETIARQALALGELGPGAAAAVNRRRAGQLSRREAAIMELLDDAVASQSIRPIAERSR